MYIMVAICCEVRPTLRKRLRGSVAGGLPGGFLRNLLTAASMRPMGATNTLAKPKPISANGQTASAILPILPARLFLIGCWLGVPSAGSIVKFVFRTYTPAVHADPLSQER